MNLSELQKNGFELVKTIKWLDAEPTYVLNRTIFKNRGYDYYIKAVIKEDNLPEFKLVFSKYIYDSECYDNQYLTNELTFKSIEDIDTFVKFFKNEEV